MKRWILATVVTVISPAVTFAAVRSFEDQEGRSFKAELTGVKDGQVILKEKGLRKPYPLSSFSLDDRDYIVKWLKDKKYTKLLQELIEASIREMNGQPLGGQAAGAAPAGGGAAGGAGPAAMPDMPPGGAAAVGGAGAGNDDGKGATEKKIMYGLNLPTDDLLKTPDERRWTDLTGQSMSATFGRVLSPGVVVLKQERGGDRRVPLVLLSREDVDYILEALKADLDVEVFPKGGYTTPTASQEAAGYRTWTDRRGERLAGKLVSHNDRDLVLEVDGQNKTFPTSGLSQDDRDRLASEDKAKQGQGAGQPVASAGPAGGMPPNFAPSVPAAPSFGGRPPGFGSRPPGFGARPPGFGAAPPMPNIPTPGFPAAGGSFPAGSGGAAPPEGSMPVAGANPMPAPSNPFPAPRTPQFGPAANGGPAVNNMPAPAPPPVVNNTAAPKANNAADGGTTTVWIPVGLIAKCIGGLLAACGIGYGANKSRS